MMLYSALLGVALGGDKTYTTLRNEDDKFIESSDQAENNPLAQLGGNPVIITFIQSAVYTRLLHYRAEQKMKKQKPVLVQQNDINLGQPNQNLVFSLQLCIFFDSWDVRYLSTKVAIMLTAIDLINGTTVVRMKDCK